MQQDRYLFAKQLHECWSFISIIEYPLSNVIQVCESTIYHHLMEPYCIISIHSRFDFSPSSFGPIIIMETWTSAIVTSQLPYQQCQCTKVYEFVPLMGDDVQFSVQASMFQFKKGMVQTHVWIEDDDRVCRQTSAMDSILSIANIEEMQNTTEGHQETFNLHSICVTISLCLMIFSPTIYIICTKLREWKEWMCLEASVQEIQLMGGVSSDALLRIIELRMMNRRMMKNNMKMRTMTTTTIALHSTQENVEQMAKRWRPRLHCLKTMCSRSAGGGVMAHYEAQQRIQVSQRHRQRRYNEQKRTAHHQH